MARWKVYRLHRDYPAVEPWSATRSPNLAYRTFRTWREAYDFADQEARR